MNLKSFAAALVLTAGAGITAPANALPSNISNVLDDEHIELLQSVEETGITVEINPHDCQSEESYGWYHAFNKRLVICQTSNGHFAPTGALWPMSEQDKNTIRHEGIHLAQDLVDSEINGRLETTQHRTEQFTQWVNDAVPSDRLTWMVDTYQDAPTPWVGHVSLDCDCHILHLEAEAEAYGFSGTASEVNDKIRYFAFGEENSATPAPQPQPQRNGSPSVGGVVNTVLGIGLGLL